MRVPRHWVWTVLVALGQAPVPSLSTLYCTPLGRLLIPSLVLLAARNFSPSFLFFSPASFRSAISLSICCFCQALRASWRSSSARRGLAPVKASLSRPQARRD